MGIFRKAKHSLKPKGFTVVELLIVIAVIGILVGIVAVMYPGYQKRARDAERRSDMSQLAAALGAYAIQKNNYMAAGSGCGLFGDGNGWISLEPPDGGGWYPKAVTTCLKDAGVISNASDFIDPLGCKSDSGGVCGTWQSVPAQGYMKATCLKGGAPITYFMTHLENEPLNNPVIDTLCDVGSLPWFDANGQKWGTNYGMNYYVIAK